MAEMGFAIGKGNTSVPGAGCGFIPNPKLKLLDQVSEVMRFKHYSIRTETTYRECIERFIFFHGKPHPQEMGGPGSGEILKRPGSKAQGGLVLPESGLQCAIVPLSEGAAPGRGRIGLGATGQTAAAAAGGVDGRGSGPPVGRHKWDPPVDGEIV